MQLENGGEIDLRASYSYTDDFFNNATNSESIRTDSYGLLDISVGYTPPDSSLKVTVFGKNVTDELYHDFALDNALTSATWGGAPDTYGVRISYSLD